MEDCISRQAAIDYLMINMAWFDEDGRMIDDWDEKKPIITDLIAGVPSAQQWISVKDRLPDAAGYECLVVGVNCFGQKSVFTAFTDYGELGWWTDCKSRMMREKDELDNRVSPVWEITHWMPLPEPPKEEKQDG